MPELPEVETTVQGLNETVIGKTIARVWSSLPQKNHKKKDEIKNETFWKNFKKKIIGTDIVQATRIGKNILIHLSSGDTILIHMKMTGHLLFGNYRKAKQSDGLPKHSWNFWGDTEALQDPFNRFIHFTIHFTDETTLAFCDARKFGKVTHLEGNPKLSPHLHKIGVDALDPNLNLKIFREKILKQKRKAIKTVLMNQELVAGIGNIYSDEMLWLSGINPERSPETLSEEEWKLLYRSMKPVLHKGIDFGGDSTSDYRNIYGEHGEFHHTHNAYRKTNTPCTKKSCNGTIKRKIVHGRSAHFCNLHQK